MLRVELNVLHQPNWETDSPYIYFGGKETVVVAGYGNSFPTHGN